jgi:antitoxin (DNA-binding transcriptional repressor) of toxin-antitoxin stability system
MAMRRVGVAELKNNLSRNLRLVEGGEVIEITDHDRAIAHLVPVEAKTRLALRPPTRPFDELRSKVTAPSEAGIDYVELLLEDRQR